MPFRLLAVLLLPVLMFAAWASAEVTVVDENFESIAVDGRPDWDASIDSSQYRVEQGESPQGAGENQRVLHVQVKGVDQYWALTLPLKGGLTGKFTVRYKVMFPIADAGDIKLMTSGAEAQAAYLRMAPRSPKVGFSTFDKEFRPLLTDIIPGDWYQVVVNIDIDAQRYSATIDNLNPAQADNDKQHAKADGLKFSIFFHKSTLKQVTSITLSRVAGNHADFFLDDVQVTAENEPVAKTSDATSEGTSGGAEALPIEVGADDLALGKPYTLSPRPNYSLTADEGDAVQLTDGQTTRLLTLRDGNNMWFHKQAVGWNTVRKPVEVTIDLGGAEPIGAVTVRTAYGRAGVVQPFMMPVLVSEDGEHFFSVGDLVPNEAPPAPDSGYAEKELRLSGLNVRARYVRLVIFPGGPFVFMDEVQVLRGDDVNAAPPAGQAVADVASFVAAHKLEWMVRRRLAIDLQQLEQLTGRPAPAPWRQAVESGDLGLAQIDLQNGLPYNALQRDIWAAIGQARVSRTPGAPPVVVQAVNPWEPVNPLDGPSTAALSRIVVNACQGAYRSAAINITNNTTDAVAVDVAAAMQQGGALPAGLLEVRQAVFVDTPSGRVISAPLAPVAFDNGQWQVDVPAGSTRQLWLTFCPQNMAPGEHALTLALKSQSPATTAAVPVTLRVFPVQFPAEKPALSTTLWDYVQPNSWYVKDPALFTPMTDMMRQYTARNPWGCAGWLMPWPKVGEELDREGNFVKEIDPARWAALDQWIELWPDAEHFMFFIAATQKLPGTDFKVATPEFDRAVAGTFKRLMDRFAMHGVGPDRVAILFVDEPHTTEQEQLDLAWWIAAQRGAKFMHFSDPTWLQPEKMSPAFVGSVDMFCPNASRSLRDRPERAAGAMQTFREYARGRTLWIYECAVPVHDLDPYNYFRLLAWRCFNHGATGQGFWALNAVAHRDTHAGSWDTFTLGGSPASILFWNDRGVTPTKYLEAIREGAEDYQILAELARAIDAAGDSPQAKDARAQLDQWTPRVTGEYGPALNSFAPGGRADADAAREALLPLLVELQKQ